MTLTFFTVTFNANTVGNNKQNTQLEQVYYRYVHSVRTDAEVLKSLLIKDCPE